MNDAAPLCRLSRSLRRFALCGALCWLAAAQADVVLDQVIQSDDKERLLGYVTALAADPDGGLYTADSRDGLLVHFGHDLRQGLPLAGDNRPFSSSRVRGLARIGSDRFAVANEGDDKVAIIDAAGKVLAKFGDGGDDEGHLGAPAGLAWSANQRLYVADKQNNRISVFGPDGVYIRTIGADSGAKLDTPEQVAVDRQERVYVFERRNSGTLSVFDAKGLLLTRFTGVDLRKPTAAASLKLTAFTEDPATGLLYLGDSENGRIYRYDWESGELLGGFGTKGRQRGQFSTISALELLADGRLAVADNDNHKIEVYALPPVEKKPLEQAHLPSVTQAPARALACTVAYRGTDDHVWCLDGKSESGRQLDGVGTAALTLKDKLDEPIAAAFGDERIVVLDDSKLKIFGTDGTLLFTSGANKAQGSDTFGTGGSQFDASSEGKFSKATDLYLRHGKIYVVDRENRRVQIFTRDGLYLDKIANPKSRPWLFEEPVTVAVDSHDTLYVGDRDLKQVLIFDKNKKLIGKLEGGALPDEKLTDIFDLEVDADDNLYLLCATPHNEATVQVYRNRELVFAFGTRGADPGAFQEPANLTIPAIAQRVVALYDRDRKALLNFNYLQVPDPVVDVAAGGGTGGTEVRWAAPGSSYISGYRVYSAPLPQGPYARQAEVQEPHAAVAHEAQNDNLYYRVTAVSGFGVEGPGSEPVLDLFQVGYNHYAAKEYDAAAESLQRLHEERPNHAETLKYLGLTRLAQQQYPAARDAFQALAKLPGFEVEGAELQVQALRAAGQEVEAKAVVDRLIASGQATQAIRLTCGELSLALDDAIGAVQCLEEALQKEPQNADAHLMMAAAYIKLGLPDQGLAQLQQARDAAPADPRVWRRSGELQQQLGHHEEAIPLFARAVELDPQDHASTLAMARSHLALKQYDQVRNLALGLTAHPETEANGHYLLGVVALEEKNFAAALLALTKATRADPKHAAAWLGLADTYAGLHQEKLVPGALAKALEADPNSFDAAIRLGRLHYAAGNYAEAAAPLRRAVELKPDDYDAHYLLADTLSHQGELKEAQQYAGEAATLAPERTEPLALQGSLAARQGKNGAAINYLKQALAKKPTDLDLQLQLAGLYVDNNMFDQAKASLEKAALVDPTRAEPQALLGRLYLKRRLFDDAITALDKAVSLSPTEENKLLLDGAYAEKNKSLEFKSNAPQIVLKELQLQPVFSAAYKQYANEPIGAIRVENVSGVDYGNLKLTFNIKGYMDFASSQEIPELKANGSLELPLKAAFNNNVLEIDEDTGVQVEVALHFVRDGRDDAITLTQPMTIYGKNAILWSRGNMVGAFVTPKDDTLRDFIRQTINENRPDPGPLNANLVTAMTVFDALSAHGIKYVVDPNSPYSKLAADQVDYVQFARETLKIKSGDCDDLTVLLAAALENLGIETAVLDVPGHLLLMFNTGLPAAEADKISSQPDLLAIRDDGVWIPVEATMITTSFAEAWNEGARKYHENLANNTLKVIPLHQAWNEYLPVTLKPADYQLGVPDHDKVAPMVAREYGLLLEKNLERLVLPYRAMVAANPADSDALMQIGIIYARNGLYDRAFATFDQLLEKNPDNSAVFNNRGNIYFARGDFDRALQSYARAEQIDGTDSGIKVNLAMTYYKQGKLEEANKKFGEATGLDDTVRSRYAAFGRLLAN